MASQTREAPYKMEANASHEFSPTGRGWSLFVIISGILLAISIIVGIIVILHIT